MMDVKQILKNDSQSEMADYLDRWMKQESIRQSGGLSGPYHMVHMTESYLAAAIKEKKPFLTAFLLDYRKKNFSEETLLQARKDLEDRETGQRELWPVEYLSEEVLEWYGTTEISAIQSAGAGQKIRFGSWPHSRTGEPAGILWDVLERRENSLSAISHFCLDAVFFHDRWEIVSWENSTLRVWMNQTFFQKAFSDKEKKLVENVSGDFVFLLSTEEIKRYFPGKENRRAAATDYAAARGVLTEDGICRYWLRTSAADPHEAVRVNYDGTIDENGTYLGKHRYVALRPAIRLKW